MKTVGIIAEYNPFHNGHAYHIAQAKKITDADYCIVVMSGNFVQRGAPAIMDKFIRARMALMCGADLIIELPVHYALASAEYFAGGAIALLDKLGVDSLCFGSECGDLSSLAALSDAMMSESAEEKSLMKEYLKTGHSYPHAKELSFSAAHPQLSDKRSLLQQPNNILAVEYLKAIKKRNSLIKPYTISRIGADYHDASIHHAYSSALAIRETIVRQNNISTVKNLVPGTAYELMQEAYQKTFPILPDDFSALLAYKLIQEAERGYRAYFDVDADFSDRIKRLLPSYTDFTVFCDALKSKNTTHTRISRNLLHILLNIYQEDVECFRSQDYLYYARILGFQKKSAPLLTKVKADSSIPLISKLADAPKLISSESGKKMLTQELNAGDIYRMTANRKFHSSMPDEYRSPIVII